MKNFETLILNKAKINNILSFNSDSSEEESKSNKFIFPILNNDFIIKKNSNNICKINSNENTKKENIMVEKGILITPLCLLSKNKNYFGSRNIKIQLQSNENDKNNMSSKKNNIKIIINDNSRNNQINTINRLSTNKTTIQSNNNFLEEKNNNKYSLSSKKIKDYRSRNKNIDIEEENNNYNDKKKDNFFTNETISSCCKDLFRKKINKLNDKKNSTINNFNRNNQLTLTLHLSKKSKNSKNNRNNNNDMLSDKFINDYNYKTMYNKTVSNKNKKRDYYYKRRGQYIFKCNPYTVKNTNIEYPEKLKILNNNNIKLLQKEAKKYFGYNFSLIQRDKFPHKFRDPSFNDCVLNNEEKKDKEKIINQKIIKENIISGIGIIKEINDKKNFEQKVLYPYREKNKKRLFSKFKSLIIKNSNYIKHISLTSYDLFKKNNFEEKNKQNINYHVNQLKKTAELIQAIKSKHIDKVKELIEQKSYSVKDGDIFQFTPLHWAVKKDFYLIIPKLISYGALVNSQNFLGETPLHISIKKNNYECTVLLLTYLASPFIKDHKGKIPFDYSNDYQMDIIYKTITNLHYKNMFVRNKLIYDNIQNDFINFILDEFRNQLKRDCVIIIEDIQREKKNRAELELKLKKRKEILNIKN